MSGGSLPRLAAGMMLSLAVACSSDADPGTRGNARAPALSVLEPPFDSFEHATMASIVTYAASLPYAEDRGVSDMQALSIRATGGGPCPGGCGMGPRVAIQPQANSIDLTDAELREGRVVGRLVNLDSMPYDRLNLSAAGTTYVVVIAADSMPWIGYLVSTDPARGSQSRIPHPVSVDAPHAGRYKESLARWVWSESGEDPWFDCGDGTCCGLDSD